MLPIRYSPASGSERIEGLAPLLIAGQLQRNLVDTGTLKRRLEKSAGSGGFDSDSRRSERHVRPKHCHVVRTIALLGEIYTYVYVSLKRIAATSWLPLELGLGWSWW